MLKAVLILIINLIDLNDEHLNNVMLYFIHLILFLNTCMSLMLNTILN